MEIQQFAKVVRVAPGSRRSIAVRVQRSSVETTPDGLRLELDLPRASYVAAIVREIIKDAGRAAS